MLTHGKWKVTLEDVTAVMLGHAIGDALGVTAEFMSREELSGALYGRIGSWRSVKRLWALTV